MREDIHMHRTRHASAAHFSASLLVAVVTSAVSLAAQAEPLYSVEQMTGVVYGTGFVTSPDGTPGTKALTMDIYRPKGYDKPDKMALLVIHGGAFTGGKPRDLEGVSRYFAERGFVCFTISYRLAGDKGPDVRKAAYSDAKSAVRWVRAHAKEFGIDPNRIGAIGHSAGAVSALQIAVTKAGELVSDGPVLAPANHPEQSSAIQAAAAIAGVLPEHEYADAQDPPLLFLHGTNDPVIPLDRAKASMKRCEEVGLRPRFLTAKGAGHDPWNERYEGADLRPQVVAFFVEELGKVKGPLPEPDGVILTKDAGKVRHTVAIAPSANGHVILDPPGGVYDAFTLVRALAMPDAGFRFEGWKSSGENPAHFDMTREVSIEPVFAPVDPAKTFKLDVSGTTHGSVTLDPSGGTYSAGTVVKLVPHPDKNYTFLAWAGDMRETLAPGYICMTGDRKVSAVFVPADNAPRHDLKLRKSEGGSIVPSVQWSTFVEGDSLKLAGRPDPGFRFEAWTDALSGSDNPAKLVMDAPKTVGADFECVLKVDPQAVTLPADGRDGTISVSASQVGGWTAGSRLRVGGWTAGSRLRGAWKVSQFFERPWLKVQPADGAIGVAVSENRTCYPRTGLLRIASDQGGVQPLLAFVQQQGQPTPKLQGQTTKGLATYQGRPGETGTLRWWSGNASDPQYGLFEANTGGGFTVGCYRGVALGYLTVDGEQPLEIPDGNDYHIYADWDLPENPEAVSDPESGGPVPTYFYIGIDSGGIDYTKLRFGIEWKDLGHGKEWVLRVQRDSDQISAVKANDGRKPAHIKLHVWKDRKGDTVVRPGGAIVRGQFSLDGGPWQDFLFSDKRTSNYYPVEGMGHDAGADRVTFKVRGLGTENLRRIRVEGLDVPGVNSAAK
jgi:acetyl esterase/lipase